MAGRQWAGTTFGSGWMHRSLVRLLRFTDVTVLYAFCDIFVVPWCLLLGRSRKFSFAFYRRRLHFGVLKSCWYACRNYCRFAQVVVDRFAMYAGKRFKVEIEGDDNFSALASQPEGFVQLSSHIGNYEIAGYTLRSDLKRIHAVVYASEKESVMRARGDMFDRTNVDMIELREDMGHLFEIDKAICDGDIVSFPSDRHMQGARCIKADFLGAQALFPQGPFTVATARGVKALAVNVMKDGLKRYRIFLTPLQYDAAAPRAEQVRQLCSAYVRELENMVRRYPAQWYNFFDFWAL